MANPTAMLLCAANMLRHVNLEEEGVRLQSAVEAVLREGKVKTRDLGGHGTSRQFTTAVIHKMHR